MRKIFLYEANKDICNLIKNAIQNEFDDEVKNASTIDEAVKEISLGDYDLIIARDKVQGSNDSVHRFIDSISSNKINSKLIAIGNVESEDPVLIAQLPEKFKMTELIEVLKKAFQQIEDSGANDYFEVNFDVLRLLKRTNFDLFSRLRSPGKKDQYITKIAKDAEVKGLSELESKGVKSLFIEKKLRLQFTNDLVSQVARGMNIDFNDLQEAMESSESVYRLARKLLSIQGTNEISYRLINCLAEEMIGNLKKSESELGNYIHSTIEHTTSYSFKHLNLISAFVFMSLPHLDIMEEKKNIYLENFVYAACFHDIILEKEGMAEIHTKKDWLECQFDDSDKNLIRDHAKLASELLEKFPGAKKEVIKIVKEHHGVPSGVGFTDRKVGSLTGASVFFDVIHDFVELFLNFPPDGSLDTMLKNLEESYQLSIYKDYVGILKMGIVDAFKA